MKKKYITPKIKILEENLEYPIACSCGCSGNCSPSRPCGSMSCPCHSGGHGGGGRRHPRFYLEDDEDYSIEEDW